jgi:hypothetical protein
MVTKNLASQVNEGLDAVNQVLSMSFRGVSDKEIASWVLKSKLRGAEIDVGIPHVNMVGPFNIASFFPAKLPIVPSDNYFKSTEGYRELEQRVAAAGGRISPAPSSKMFAHLRIVAN